MRDRWVHLPKPEKPWAVANGITPPIIYLPERLTRDLWEATVTEILEFMWEQHRGYLRRMLGRMAGDDDVAEDLLQETYLRAHEGLRGYRGGEARAWLAAIAKNVFLELARRQGRRREESLDVWLGEDQGLATAPDPALALQLREAVARLSPVLREGLILRYYGGLSYDEIAARCGCPVATARRRVWSAIQRLRVALHEPQAADGRREMIAMATEHVRGAQLLDYVMGALAGSGAEGVRGHLASCAECAAEEAELRRLADALDEAQGEHVLLSLHELDAEGTPTYYALGRVMNDSAEPMATFGMLNPDTLVTDHFVAQGAELPLEVRAGERPGMTAYVAQLPRPVPPGEGFWGMAVSHSCDAAERAQRTDDGTWVYRSEQGVGDQARQSVLIYAVALPEGAKLTSTEPNASETRQGPRRTTVVWRMVPAPQAPQEFTARYR